MKKDEIVRLLRITGIEDEDVINMGADLWEMGFEFGANFVADAISEIFSEENLSDEEERFKQIILKKIKEEIENESKRD